MSVGRGVTGKGTKLDVSTLGPKAVVEVGPVCTRLGPFDGNWHDRGVFDRLPWPVGTVIKGPAILTQPDTTVLIEPDLQGRVDAFGNTIIEPVEGTA